MMKQLHHDDEQAAQVRLDQFEILRRPE
jgi:hypothetical protein